MKNFKMIIVITLTAVAVSQIPSASAGGISTLLRNGAKLLSRSSAKAGREAAETGIRRATSSGLSTASRTSAKAASRASGQVIVRGGGTVVRSGSTRIVLDHLGPAGAQAMKKLSAGGSRKLAEASAQLAKSPHKTEWLKVISRHGDAAANYVWKNKRAIVVAAGATAAVVAPDDFLKTVGDVASTTVTVAGDAIVRPLITEASRHVAAPVARELARQAAVSFPWGAFWGILGLTMLAGFAYGYYRFRSAR